MHEHAASTYAFNGRILFHADARTIHGLWRPWGPVFASEESTPDDLLGTRLLMTLSRSREGVRPPTRIVQLFDPLIWAADARSPESFVRRAVACGVRFDGERYRFIRSLADRREKSAVSFADRELSVPAGSTPQELGAALRSMLCERRAESADRALG